jgi:hypothetical protein
MVMTTPSWVPDQEIKPGPMPLLLVQSFVNTWDSDNRSDLPTLQVGPGEQISLGPDPASRPDAGLLTLLLVIRDAQRDGTWPRLKACGNPECLWAFYDRSHSRAGAWCDMATCGNRIKNRRLRQRQR